MKKTNFFQVELLLILFQSIFRMRVLAVVLILSIFQLATLSYSQDSKISVSGKVKDTAGAALPGVSVIAKGTSQATITNTEGVFKLALPANTKTLVFSFMGMKTKEVAIAGNTTFNVVLEDGAVALQEVVAIGYGQMKRRDVTGSLVSVDVKDMTKAPVGNFTEMLAGRASGVVVTFVDGQPGSMPNIVIRGANSITQDNSPLWVIDGFPLEKPDNGMLNPSDIESMEVLKDASATAIYGARGANGVILITTKKGKLGAPIITFNAYFGEQNILKTMKLMNSYDFVQYQNERDVASNNLVTNTTGQQTITESQYMKFSTMDAYKNIQATDFQSLMFRPADIKNYDLSIGGGTEQTKYMFSGNMLDQKGVTINSGFSRYQGRFSLDQTVNPKLKVGLNVLYAYMKQYGGSPNPSEIKGYFGSASSPFYAIWGFRPVTPLDENGKQSTDLTTEFQDNMVLATSGDLQIRNMVNPYLNQLHLMNENINENLNVTSYLDYKITSDLNLRVTGGLVKSLRNNNQFYDNFTAQGSPYSGFGSIALNNGSVVSYGNSTWSNENILTYKKNVGTKHHLMLTAVASEQGGTSSSYGFSAIQVPNPSIGINGLDEGVPQYVTANSSLWTLASAMGRANYDYANKYYLTYSIRWDGSSKFSQENRWSNFQSGSFKWRFYNEKWIKEKFKSLADGSIRLSIGQTGNNRIPDFASYSTMSTSSITAPFVMGNTILTSAKPSVIGNRNLKWETTIQSNAGLDLAFFKSRLTLSVDVYKKTTNNLLLNATLPPTIGYNTAMKNIGSLSNQGLEISVNTVNVNTGGFSWTSSFNISFNQSKVLSLAENQESLLLFTPFDANFLSSPSYIAKIGEPLGEMYGLVSDGLYSYNDFTKVLILNYAAGNSGAAGSHWLLKDNVPTNGNVRASIQPGDVKYKDLNGDGVINSDDQTIIGHGLPIHTGGFGNNFSYKGIELNIFFQWSYGNDIQNANRIIFEGNASNRSYFNQFASYNDRWTPENITSHNFRVGGYGPTGYYSNRTIEDGSYLRLKTVSLGYNIPKKIVLALGMRSIKINVSGQNLITWTKYTGMDPEVSTFNSVLTPGFDWSAYPKARIITGGINLTF